MPFQVSCPGCKTTYNLSDEMRGKAIRCKNCSKAFRTADKVAVGTSASPINARQNRPGQPVQRPATARPAAARPAAARPAPKRTNQRRPAGNVPARQPANEFGLDDIVRDDVFAGSTPSAKSDPLGNHVVHDPGFAHVDPAKYEPKKVQDSQNSLYYNPAVSGLVSSIEKSAVNSPLRQKPFWIPTIVVGILLLVVLPVSVLLLFVVEPLGVAGCIFAFFITATATAYAEIWTLVRINKYFEGENFMYYLFWAWARIGFTFQHWDWMKDVGSLWLIGLAGNLVMILVFIIIGSM